MLMDNKIINWFIPTRFIHGRTNIELARVFVFTHLFGPVIAQPMVIYLWMISPEVTAPLEVMMIGINSFLLLPFVMRWTGNMTLAALLSYQGLASISLFGTLCYGGFSSPFLPWLIVSLLLGFFYLSKKALLVLGLFAADLAVFLIVLAWKGLPNTVPIADLRILGWLSIVAAMVYMSWMALYYARMIALRSELQTEAERFRNTELELEKARNVAEKISGQRSMFFAKMSHELRTPLNVIIGYSEILLEDCNEKDGIHRQCAKDLSRINSAGKHLLSLVAEVLDSEKIEKDVTSVETSEFTTGELCDDVVANAMPLITKNGNKLVLDCPVRNEVVLTDRTKVLQILINLLSNAGKFTNNGTVTLHLSVEKDTADSRIYAYVRDTGIGIAPAVLPKLFQDYIQADASISNRFGGTGIGLAITRKFSVLLGGEVRVTSRPGEGSCFTLDIPARLTTDAVPSQMPGTPATARQGQVSQPEAAKAA
ncbi:ATP-binding protein [uncultured Hoeflea sp.]|uniref:sensor histidine kinase n=1 Tax=uncultured Hoeflea sp. TaxID=538666 RepID=UPI002616D4C5|nr:ATP-binding protein [uncultured Hoeflea sp.]